MSWWDKYFAPGDVRQQRQQIEQAATIPKDELQQSPIKPNIPTRVNDATRARRQNALLYGGAAFLGLSIFVTRRALIRKKLAAYPNLVKTQGGNAKIDVPTFTNSNVSPRAEGGLDAAEALFLATLNTFSLFMFGTGAFMKYNNIGDVEDLRDWVRQGVGYDVYAGDTEADKEIEQWMAEILSRKDGVGDLKTSIVEKIAELAEIEKKKTAEGGSVSKELAELQKQKKALEQQAAEKS